MNRTVYTTERAQARNAYATGREQGVSVFTTERAQKRELGYPVIIPPPITGSEYVVWSDDKYIVWSDDLFITWIPVT